MLDFDLLSVDWTVLVMYLDSGVSSQQVHSSLVHGLLLHSLITIQRALRFMIPA